MLISFLGDMVDEIDESIFQPTYRQTIDHVRDQRAQISISIHKNCDLIGT
jgi:hypothetical protein